MECRLNPGPSRVKRVGGYEKAQPGTLAFGSVPNFSADILTKRFRSKTPFMPTLPTVLCGMTNIGV